MINFFSDGKGREKQVIIKTNKAFFNDFSSSPEIETKEVCDYIIVRTLNLVMIFKCVRIRENWLKHNSFQFFRVSAVPYLPNL